MDSSTTIPGLGDDDGTSVRTLDDNWSICIVSVLHIATPVVVRLIVLRPNEVGWLVLIRSCGVSVTTWDISPIAATSSVAPSWIWATRHAASQEESRERYQSEDCFHCSYRIMWDQGQVNPQWAGGPRTPYRDPPAPSPSWSVRPARHST